jgi:putative membrane protein
MLISTKEIVSQEPKKVSPSRVQEHLANERTYLAWMRTAIALMGFGVVILRLRAMYPTPAPHPGLGWKLGLLFAVVGLLAVLFSTQQYFAVRQQIEDCCYIPGTQWVIFFSLAVTLLGTGTIYFVFTSVS